MSTFCAVDDAALIKLIQSARKRIVFIAPGLHEPVATALGERFHEIDGLDVTVVLDPDEDVCRIGFGDAKGLELVNEYAKKNGFWVRSQPGLRVGVLLADDQTLVWSPTPRSVEAPPDSMADQPDLTDAPNDSPSISLASPGTTSSLPGFAPQASSVVPSLAPNGLLLGANPGEQLAKAVAAEGTDADPKHAEIGKSAITPEQVKTTLDELKKNPPIDVDLARVTRVFSTKLQFVELEIKGAKISQTQLTVPSVLLNADANEDLQGLIQSKLNAFTSYKKVEVSVPAYHNGTPLLDANGNPLMDRVSEASLQRTRTAFESRFIHDITGFGRLIAKDEKEEFEAHLEALKVQLLAHAKGIKEMIDAQSTEIIDKAIDLIMERSQRSGSSHMPNPQQLQKILHERLVRSKEDEPKISLVFKDVTFEQTKSDAFRRLVDKALPADKRIQLGRWSEHFDAARELAPEKP